MTNYNNSSNSALPMKWHKFLANFALWAGAFYNFYQASLFMSGENYGSEDQRDLVYQAFDGLQTVDMIVAFSYIIMAFFGMYTAVQLVKLKQNAPQKLMILYIALAVIPIIYIIMASSSTGIPTAELMKDNYSVYASVVSGVLGMIICKVYYDKRQHMFTN